MADVVKWDLTAKAILLDRLPEEKISESSFPTESNAEDLLTKAAARVNGVLTSIEITPSDITSVTATAVDYQNVRTLVEDGFVGYFLMARRGKEASKDAMKAFEDGLKLLKTSPSEIIPDSASSTSGRTVSHISKRTITDSGSVSQDATPPVRFEDDL